MTPCASVAQPRASRIPLVDYLSQGSEADRGVFLLAFKQGLRELGWVDGKNVVIDVHWSAPHEFPQLAASLVKRDPAAIVGTCIPSTRAAKNATDEDRTCHQSRMREGARPQDSRAAAIARRQSDSVLSGWFSHPVSGPGSPSSS
jgi:hypothetical protein